MLKKQRTLKLHSPGFEIENFLNTSVQTCAALEKIHAAGTIHKAICPSLIKTDTENESCNILCCKCFFKGGNLIDHNGTILTDDHSIPSPLTRFELLNIMSPEQTGRFNWSIDHRSDLYSLGAVFYKWTTGQYPFRAQDELGFFHGHIAKDPSPPHQISSDLPIPVSRIILKLLHKSPEQRYQSATGVLKDLKVCRDHLNDISKLQPFTPGRFDVPYFRIKNKIYGRTKETGILTAQLQQVMQGNASHLFISGHSGVGKTGLIEAFIKDVSLNPSLDKSPVCLYGKFDRLEQNKPYQAIIQALKQLKGWILSQDNTHLVRWKKTLASGLAGEGRIVSELVPEFNIFLQPNQDNYEHDSTNVRQFTNTGFIHFFNTISNEKTPLILAIDDLHWADQATLGLLQSLMKHQIPWIFVIGTFRKEEVKEKSFLNTLATQKTCCYLIELNPLTSEHIMELITDANQIDTIKAEKLAQLIHDKTKGSPFFIIQFLTSLYRNKSLIFNQLTATWNFDETQIRTLGVTDNVATLLNLKVEQLSLFLKELLSFGSCTGNSFNAHLMEQVVECPLTDIINALLFLKTQDFLIQNGNQWRFSHDQIKENIYHAMTKEDRKKKHLLLGKALLNDKTSSTRTFDILQHFNLCRSMISNIALKKRIAELNLEAGLAARQSVAFETACFYAEAGLTFLPGNAFELFPDLCTDLHSLAGETGYYAERNSFATRALQEVQRLAPNAIKRIKAFDLMMKNQIQNGNVQKAWHTGLTALGQVGMKLPGAVTLKSVASEFILTRWHLLGKEPESLEFLPKMNDPKLLAIIQIYARLCEISYLVAHEYIFLLVLKIFNLTLKHGENELSGYVYALYGAVMCERLGYYNEGYRFGKLALKVHKQPYMAKTKPRTLLVFGGMIQPWKKPLKDNFSFLLESHRLGIKNGNDLLFASFAMNQYLSQLMISGRSLGAVASTFEEQIEFFNTTNPHADNRIFNISFEAIHSVLDRNDDPRILKGHFFDETIEFQEMLQNQDTSLRVFYMMKAIIAFLFYDWEKAIEMTDKGLKLLNRSIGVLMWPYYSYVKALSLLAKYHGSSKKHNASLLRAAKSELKKLKKISKHSPENFSSMHELIKAEINGIKGNFKNAVIGYEQAINTAAENGYVHLEAIANECAARFFLKQKNKTIASAYITRAYKLFLNWEAYAKLKHLDLIYPDLLFNYGNKHSPSQKIVNSLIGNTSSAPGMISILKASQAISKEMDIRSLMKRLMEIVIENAGANRGVLILLKEDEPLIEAVALSNRASYPIKLPLKLEQSFDLPVGLIHYVLHSKETIVLADAQNENMFASDGQIKTCQAKSILCLPMVHEHRIVGAFYLDNNRINYVFNQKRISVLKMVADILTNAWLRKIAQEELAIYQDKLRALSSKMSLAEENERKNIAQGLHDRIGQSLVVSKMKLQSLLDFKASEKEKKLIRDLLEITTKTIEQTRSLTFDLSSPELYKLGLEAALDSLCERKERLYNFPIHFFDDGAHKPLKETSRVLLYQVVRELLFNIAKHAKTQSVHVAIHRSKKHIVIDIEDDGIGFDVSGIEAKYHKTKGFGLFSIQERMNHHKFEFAITSFPGQGTKVRLSAPLNLS